MRVITKRRLKEFWEKHRKAEGPLLAWYKLVTNAHWKNFAEVKATFNSADYYANLVIFDVGGNKYRVIAAIHYNTGMLFIRHAFTHPEYDKWKKLKGGPK